MTREDGRTTARKDKNNKKSDGKSLPEVISNARKVSQATTLSSPGAHDIDRPAIKPKREVPAPLPGRPAGANVKPSTSTNPSLKKKPEPQSLNTPVSHAPSGAAPQDKDNKNLVGSPRDVAFVHRPTNSMKGVNNNNPPTHGIPKDPNQTKGKSDNTAAGTGSWKSYKHPVTIGDLMGLSRPCLSPKGPPPCSRPFSPLSPLSPATATATARLTSAERGNVARESMSNGKPKAAKGVPCLVSKDKREAGHHAAAKGARGVTSGRLVVPENRQTDKAPPHRSGSAQGSRLSARPDCLTSSHSRTSVHARSRHPLEPNPASGNSSNRSDARQAPFSRQEFPSLGEGRSAADLRRTAPRTPARGHGHAMDPTPGVVAGSLRNNSDVLPSVSTTRGRSTVPQREEKRGWKVGARSIGPGKGRGEAEETSSTGVGKSRAVMKFSMTTTAVWHIKLNHPRASLGKKGTANGTSMLAKRLRRGADALQAEGKPGGRDAIQKRVTLFPPGGVRSTVRGKGFVPPPWHGMAVKFNPKTGAAAPSPTAARVVVHKELRPLKGRRRLHISGIKRNTIALRSAAAAATCLSELDQALRTFTRAAYPVACRRLEERIHKLQSTTMTNTTTKASPLGLPTTITTDRSPNNSSSSYHFVDKSDPSLGHSEETISDACSADARGVERNAPNGMPVGGADDLESKNDLKTNEFDHVQKRELSEHGVVLAAATAAEVGALQRFLAEMQGRGAEALELLRLKLYACRAVMSHVSYRPTAEVARRAECAFSKLLLDLPDSLRGKGHVVGLYQAEEKIEAWGERDIRVLGRRCNDTCIEHATSPNPARREETYEPEEAGRQGGGCAFTGQVDSSSIESDGRAVDGSPSSSSTTANDRSPSSTSAGDLRGESVPYPARHMRTTPVSAPFVGPPVSPGQRRSAKGLVSTTAMTPEEEPIMLRHSTSRASYTDRELLPSSVQPCAVTLASGTVGTGRAAASSTSSTSSVDSDSSSGSSDDSDDSDGGSFSPFPFFSGGRALASQNMNRGGRGRAPPASLGGRRTTRGGLIPKGKSFLSRPPPGLSPDLSARAIRRAFALASSSSPSATSATPPYRTRVASSAVLPGSLSVPAAVQTPHGSAERPWIVSTTVANNDDTGEDDNADDNDDSLTDAVSTSFSLAKKTEIPDGEHSARSSVLGVVDVDEGPVGQRRTAFVVEDAEENKASSTLTVSVGVTATTTLPNVTREAQMRSHTIVCATTEALQPEHEEGPREGQGRYLQVPPGDKATHAAVPVPSLPALSSTSSGLLPSGPLGYNSKQGQRSVPAHGNTWEDTESGSSSPADSDTDGGTSYSSDGGSVARGTDESRSGRHGGDATTTSGCGSESCDTIHVESHKPQLGLGIRLVPRATSSPRGEGEGGSGGGGHDTTCAVFPKYGPRVANQGREEAREGSGPPFPSLFSFPLYGMALGNIRDYCKGRRQVLNAKKRAAEATLTAAPAAATGAATAAVDIVAATDAATESLVEPIDNERISSASVSLIPSARGGRGDEVPVLDGLTCLVCYVTCNGPTTLAAHLASARHVKRAAARISQGFESESGSVGLDPSSPDASSCAGEVSESMEGNFIERWGTGATGTLESRDSSNGQRIQTGTKAKAEINAQTLDGRLATGGAQGARVPAASPPSITMIGATPAERKIDVAAPTIGGSGGGAPHRAGMRIHRLVDQALSATLDAQVAEMLGRVRELQERAEERNPVKAAAHRWFLQGFKESLRAVRSGRAAMVVIAPNVEDYGTAATDAFLFGDSPPTPAAEGAAARPSRFFRTVDGSLEGLLAECAARSVPVVFALSRRRLGVLLNGGVGTVSAVALLSQQVSGGGCPRLQALQKEVLRLAADGRAANET